jgi:hypothetical protein
MLTSIAQINTDTIRIHAENDVRCQKGVGLLTGCIGLTTTVIALYEFRDACDMSASSSVVPSVVSWELGAGWWCLLVAALAKAIDVFLHAVVPCPEDIASLSHRSLVEEPLFADSCGCLWRIATPEVIAARGVRKDPAAGARQGSE